MSTTAPGIDAELAGRLIAAQFPRWARLPLTLLDPAGSDHVIFRLGETMTVRLPRGDWAAGQAVKEHAWLPLIGPLLPVAVPVPLGLGVPDLGYPWHWSVTRWLDGVTATPDGFADDEATARRLAGFLARLQRIAPAETLLPGPHPELADAPLVGRDEATRAAIAAVGGDFDAVALTEVWDRALKAPAWDREPVWFHGDLHTGNLLAVDGRLSAVIDFGGLGMGDPACDLVIAWTLMTAGPRSVFRAELDIDDGAWERGRGWALATGLNAYTAYAATHPRVAAQTRRQIEAVLADHTGR
ncbi:aminoglycoside phosphotransferase family protein [Streptomyces katsurahamanus]|uniref:aminoglycoside phosphotransferase family protein n=1 Tax=Streptomyces katsurahamanus TaxID=2577098 RepID=UPI002B1EA871|nr:aminoglycoside phosphotransferase family protein [Streptomyces katsurahamanus]